MRLTAVRKLVRARSPSPISSRKKIAPLTGSSATSSSASTSDSKVGGPLKPMFKKKPTRNSSFKLHSTFVSSCERL